MNYNLIDYSIIFLIVEICRKQRTSLVVWVTFFIIFIDVSPWFAHLNISNQLKSIVF